MQKLNTNAALLMDDEMFRRTVIDRLNKIVDALATGVVHENRVAADRAVNQVYDDLPVSTTAEMIKEEITAAEAILGLNETEV